MYETIIIKKLTDLVDLFNLLEQNPKAIVYLQGKSGSGKTTIASILQQRLNELPRKYEVIRQSFAYPVRKALFDKPYIPPLSSEDLDNNELIQKLLAYNNEAIKLTKDFLYLKDKHKLVKERLISYSMAIMREINTMLDFDVEALKLLDLIPKLKELIHNARELQLQIEKFVELLRIARAIVFVSGNARRRCKEFEKESNLTLLYIAKLVWRFFAQRAAEINKKQDVIEIYRKNFLLAPILAFIDSKYVYSFVATYQLFRHNPEIFRLRTVSNLPVKQIQVESKPVVIFDDRRFEYESVNAMLQLYDVLFAREFKIDRHFLDKTLPEVFVKVEYQNGREDALKQYVKQIDNELTKAIEAVENMLAMHPSEQFV